MNIELRTDKNIRNSDRLITYVRTELNQERSPACPARRKGSGTTDRTWMRRRRR